MPIMRAGNNTYFDSEQFLKQLKFYEVEICTPLVGLEPTTP